MSELDGVAAAWFGGVSRSKSGGDAMTVRLLTCPDDYEYIGTVMSNADHQIEPGAEQRLKTEAAYGSYPGWEFFGEAVWFADGEFHCEVWRYHAHVETVSAGTLEDLMAEVSGTYGWD